MSETELTISLADLAFLKPSLDKKDCIYYQIPLWNMKEMLYDDPILIKL